MKLSTLRKHLALIIRVGLALVFLANSYIAFISPEEFSELIGKSFLAGLLPIVPDSLVKFIGISDGAVGILLLLDIKLKYAAAYATLWIIGVMAVIGVKEPGDFLEHFGPLTMSIYLILNNKDEDSIQQKPPSPGIL